MVSRVEPTPDGLETVTTVCGRMTTTFRGVPAGLLLEGQKVDQSPPHQSRSVNVQWSPFDEEGFIDDD